MLKSNSVVLGIALSAVALFAMSQTVSAQESRGKLTYQQAFAKCKQELDAAGVGGANTHAAFRHSAGGGCMQKYGFRLKKKAKI